MAAHDRRRNISVKGYYKRARAFGVMMLLVALGYLIYYLFTQFSG